MKVNDLVFVDTETNMLDHSKRREAGMLELAYAVGRQEPVTIYGLELPSFIEVADPGALAVNKYLERFACEDDAGDWITVAKMPSAPGPDGRPGNMFWLALPDNDSNIDGQWQDFLDAINGKVWIGANPRFDVAFVDLFCEQFELAKPKPSHRLFDIQAWYAGYTGTLDLPSWSDIASEWTDLKPDHTSAGDVRTMQDAMFNMWAASGVAIEE